VRPIGRETFTLGPQIGPTAVVSGLGRRKRRSDTVKTSEGHRNVGRDNKDIVGRWFTEFWRPKYNPAVIDELAAPDIRFEYSLHEPLRGRHAVRDFATKFRPAIPDLEFGGTDLPIGGLPEPNTGKRCASPALPCSRSRTA
jgi:hypothetical protein